MFNKEITDIFTNIAIPEVVQICLLVEVVQSSNFIFSSLLIYMHLFLSLSPEKKHILCNNLKICSAIMIVGLL